MEESKNFIEQIIEKDLADGVYEISARTEWISPYRTCKVHSLKLRTGKKIQWNF